MGRFSPNVAPVPDTGLANALGNFTESYMQFAARRRQKDMDAIETGVGLSPVDGSAPQSAPSGPIASLRARLTGRTNPNDIASAVQNAAPALQGANAVNAGVAQALSRGDGGFVQNKPTSGANYAENEAIPEMPRQMRLPSGQIIATAMTPLGQRMLQARLAALGMGSEIALRNSEVNKNNRDASVPRLGDAGYAAAIAGVEGAKAQATLGPDLQKLVAQGVITRQTALDVERARAGTSAALQANQQQFTAGQNAMNRGAESERQSAAKGEDLSNKLTEIQATQSGQILPTLIRGAKGFFGSARVDVPGVTKPLGSKPAPTPGAAAPTDMKVQRADWDAAAAHARQQGKDPDELLGPRP